jgi:hypothetical protein
VGAAGGECSDILLGPEGTSAVARLWRGCLVFLGSGPWPVTKLLSLSWGFGLVVGVGVWWSCGWWGWSLFENCTVDASIFVVKLPRADGECLGTRSR